MASVHIIYGIAKEGMPVFSGNGLKSETISLPNSGAAIAGDINAARVTAIDSAAWVWLSGDGTTNPRIYLALGASIDFYLGLGGKTISAKAYP